MSYTSSEPRSSTEHVRKHYENYNLLEFTRARRECELYEGAIGNAASICLPSNFLVDTINQQDHIAVISSIGNRITIPQARFDIELHNYRIVIVNSHNTEIYHIDWCREACDVIDGLYYLKSMCRPYEWWTRLDGVDWENREINVIYPEVPMMFFERLLQEVDHGYPICIQDTLYSPRSDSVRYCEHYEEWFMEEDCQYDDDQDCYFHVDAPNRTNGDTRNTRDFINDYHHGPTPNDYSNTDTIRTDVAGLDQFTIGFEIEKTRVNNRRGCGQAVSRQPLFSHWETDSSCGVEGITNIYNLGDFDTFQKHVIASDYVDEPTGYDCGGHTNVAFKPNNICDFNIQLEDISTFAGPIYSMYKKRLRNTYSSYNKKLNANNRERYGAIVMKRDPDRVEFRLPSRINNKRQLLRRFKLFQHLFSHIYNYVENRDKYMDTMNTINSRLDVEFGDNTLYRNFKYDTCFKSAFYKSILYKKIRFLLWDIKDFLEPAYKNRIDDLKIMVINSYQFQAWLDDDPTANLTSILQYLRNQESEGPRHLLTDAQRNWRQDQEPWDMHDDLNDTDALEVAHNNTTETTEV